MTFAHCNPFAGHDMLLGHDMSCPNINIYHIYSLLWHNALTGGKP